MAIHSLNLTYMAQLPVPHPMSNALYAPVSSKNIRSFDGTYLPEDVLQLGHDKRSCRKLPYIRSD